MTKALTIWVDTGALKQATEALVGHDVLTTLHMSDTPPDLILSEKARYFDPDWYSDPKLVEAALKRARAEKRAKKGKK